MKKEKNKSRRLLINGLLLSLVLSVFMLNVLAASATPAYSKKLSRGVYSLTYWFENISLESTYGSNIIAAANSWKNLSNPTSSFTRQYNNLGTAFDFYLKTNSFWPGQTGVLAENRSYNSSGAQVTNKDGSDWYFNRIYVNNNTMSTKTSAQRQGTFAHEIGHGLGLKENNSNVNSIMCQTGSGRAVQTPQSVDNTAIVNKY